MADQIEMGLGEAVLRLMHVEMLYSNDVSQTPQALVAERQLIVEALNQHKLLIGLDCDGDGLPETAVVFKEAADESPDSCCRIVSSSSKTRPRKSSRKKRSS